MKDSGIEWLGEVPAHWGFSKKLADLAAKHRHSFVNGPFGSDLLTSELIAEGVPVIYIRDLKSAGYQRVSEWCVTPEKAMEIVFCNVLPDDILIAKVGDPPGLAAVYPKGEPEGIVTQDVMRLRADLEQVDPRFLVFLLNSDYGRALIDSISVESTRTRVGLGDYKTLRFVLPVLDEQRQIVFFLDEQTTKLDTLTAEALRAIDLLKEHRCALISAAVTGKIDVRGLNASEAA
jgi:type I restriction enzyme S subunit